MPKPLELSTAPSRAGPLSSRGARRQVVGELLGQRVDHIVPRGHLHRQAHLLEGNLLVDSKHRERARRDAPRGLARRLGVARLARPLEGLDSAGCPRMRFYCRQCSRATRRQSRARERRQSRATCTRYAVCCMRLLSGHGHCPSHPPPPWPTIWCRGHARHLRVVVLACPRDA